MENLNPEGSRDPQPTSPGKLRLLQLTGCSRLCYVLGGLGVVISLGSAAATHQLLHEPLESVAAASSLHMAAAFCTANDAVLTRLAMARSAALTPTAEQASAGSAQPTIANAAEFHSGADPDLQHTPLVQIAVLHLEGPSDRLLLQPSEPLAAQAIADVGLAGLIGQTSLARRPRRRSADPGRAGSDLNNQTSRTRPCADHGLEALGNQTRVLPLRQPATQAATVHKLVYALGPWPRQDGTREMVLAITDINGLTESIGELREHLDAGDEAHSIPLNINTRLIPRGEARDTALRSERITSDQKLDNGRWMPFANGKLAIQVGVDHGSIDRTSRRAAALTFAMGLGATMMIVLISRYSQLKLLQLNQILRRESRTDGLTKLANRRAWDEAILRADQPRQRETDAYGIVVIDLDRFKQINDTEGHQKGDQILVEAANILRREAREADLAARLGGDEFALLLINPSEEGLIRCTNRISQALGSASIKASIGASLSHAGKRLEATWAEADNLMYQEKNKH